MVAGESDQLWSDATLVRYINEAQRRFARRSLVLRDGVTADVTQVTLATGTTTYTLHEAVLAVISVKLVGDQGDMARAGHATLGVVTRPDTLYFDPAQVGQLPPGKPLVYSTDETLGEDAAGSLDSVVLRVYPAPTATYNGQKLQMRVARLPVEELSVLNPRSIPELPRDHHLEMLDWAAYLALRIMDVDAGWSSRAEDFKKSFEVYVKEARDSMMRKVFTPLQWGFGRNGFTWER